MKYDRMKFSSKNEAKAYMKNYVKNLDVDHIKTLDEYHIVVPYIDDMFTIELIKMMRANIDKTILDKVKFVITRDVKGLHQKLKGS